MLSSLGQHDHDDMEKINQLRLKATLKESVQNTFQLVKRSYDTAVVAETAGPAGAAFDARVRELMLLLGPVLTLQTRQPPRS